jgi:hypothetical protein
MKNKLFLLLVIIAAVGIAVVLSYGKVWAQQEGPTEPFDEAKALIPVEFTDYLDDSASNPGGAIIGPDPLQVLFTQPPDAPGAPYPSNTFDYGDYYEVDALANRGDYLTLQLACIDSTRFATLLLSFAGDPGGVAVWYETPRAPAIRGPLWTKTALCSPPTNFDDLDALEVWGPSAADDADRYSMQTDAVGGVSVFSWPGAVPYIPHAVIAAAVAALGGPSNPADVDLDALMVWDMGTQGAWGTGDVIIFSIRAAAPWDGGEIVVLQNGVAPSYLNHGGHLWNTAFGVAAAFNLDPPTEEVDAIEAYPWFVPGGKTPTLTEWGLIILVALLIASTVFIVLRRRKAAVPA